MADRRFPNKFLVVGTFFTIIGVVLLLWSSGYVSDISPLWPLVFVIGGVVLLFQALRIRDRFWLVFVGTFVGLSGIVLLVSTVFPRTMAISRTWPLFMCSGGAALISFGFTRSGPTRYSLVIPGSVIAALSVLFLLFSLHVIDQSFREFVSIWWPSLVVLLGASLITIDFVNRNRQKWQRRLPPGSGNGDTTTGEADPDATTDDET